MIWITPEDITAVYPTAVITAGFIAHIQALAESCIGEQTTVSTRLAAAFVDVVYRKKLASDTNPTGMTQEHIGDYGYSMTNNPGLGLTNSECARLKKAIGRGSLWVQPLDRGDLETPGLPLPATETDWT